MRTGILIVLGIVIGSTLSSMIAIAWSAPTASPPGNNVASPINTGATSQLKNGTLGVNALGVFGDSILSGGGGQYTYLNFGATAGSGGYGIRNNNGTLEFRNSSDGSWGSLNVTLTNLMQVNGITSNGLGQITSIKFGDGTTQSTAAGSSGGVAPSFSVNKGGIAQTVASNTSTKLTFGTVVFDTTNSWSAANNRYTPTVAGKYIITAGAYCNGGTTGCGVYIFKNGSLVASSYINAASWEIPTVSAVITLNGTSDYVEAWVWNASGTMIDGGAANTYMTGSLVAASGSVSFAGMGAGTANTVPLWSSSTNLTNSNIYQSGGNIGIGNAAPAYKLEVNGTIAADSGYATRTGNNGSFGGNTFNVNWVGGCAQLWIDVTNVGNLVCFSDQRLKKNIRTVDVGDGLSTIQKLHPVSFEWKRPQGEGMNIRQYGFIAQEVRQIIPDLVQNTGMRTADTPDGALKLDYDGLIAPIVKAIQEIATVTGTFKTNIIAFLGSAENGISKIVTQVLVADETDTHKLCVAKSDGTNVCVTGDQLAALLANQAPSKTH